MGPHYASNNWVVDGAHTTSGKPLLANDPHLGFSTPGFWYVARLKTPQHDIAGATVAGTPLVVIGHNEKIAWGFTTTTADIEDLYIEKLDPNDASHYMVADGSLPFRTRSETINGHRPRHRLGELPRRAQKSRRAAAKHRLRGYWRDNRIYRRWADADPKERRRLVAGAWLERRLRLARLHPVR
jgi:acyl-homoserine lactone acylase PvdQ